MVSDARKMGGLVCRIKQCGDRGEDALCTVAAPYLRAAVVLIKDLVARRWRPHGGEHWPTKHWEVVLDQEALASLVATYEEAGYEVLLEDFETDDEDSEGGEEPC